VRAHNLPPGLNSAFGLNRYVPLWNAKATRSAQRLSQITRYVGFASSESPPSARRTAQNCHPKLIATDNVHRNLSLEFAGRLVMRSAISLCCGWLKREALFRVRTTSSRKPQFAAVRCAHSASASYAEIPGDDVSSKAAEAGIEPAKSSRKDRYAMSRDTTVIPSVSLKQSMM
jgi:hypothetical protein